MITELLAIGLFALLFVVFGLLHPADAAGDGGCGGCHGSDGTGECGVACPLLKDIEASMNEKLREREMRHERA